MIDIPPEIWYRIACFIPDEDLCHLLGVNNVFFEIGMNLRWKDVSIETRNTFEAMRIITRLSNPYISRRLKHIRLRLTHVKAKHTRASSSQDKSKDFKHLKQHFYVMINRVFKIKRVHSDVDTLALARSDPRQSRPTFSDVMEAIINATPQFVNVNELTIDSWDLPPSYGNLGTLFSSFWTSFGDNLQQLSLGGNVEGFQVLIKSNPYFRRLHTLRMEFTNNVFRVDQAKDSAILVDVVAPFVNSLNTSLTALEVWSWANLDLSLFFQRLEVLPALNHLNIRMAFNKALSNPSGLQHLLCESSGTIEKIDLRLNPSGLPFNHTAEEPLSHWLALCIEDRRCFSRLRHLDIYPTNTSIGMDVLLASIKRTSQTLVHLTIRDRYLHPPDATLILEAASRCTNLKYLRMNVLRLNVALLDLLATHVPWIQHLWLAVGEIFSDHAGLAQNFSHELHERTYVNWNLKDLSISQGGQDIDREALEAIAKAIPSIDSFFGRGHMEIP